MGLELGVGAPLRFVWKLSDDLVNVITEPAFAGSSPRSYGVVFHLGGAVSRVSGGDTAFGNRQVSQAITLDAVWQPGEDYGDEDIAWTRGFFTSLDRLAGVKAKYDPDNVFHHNQNIGSREMKVRTVAT